jgi:hypothetical protein
MPYVCLLLSGAALLVNGLATLGHLPRRDAAVLSLVVGIVQVVLGVVVLSPGTYRSHSTDWSRDVFVRPDVRLCGPGRPAGARLEGAGLVLRHGGSCRAAARRGVAPRRSPAVRSVAGLVRAVGAAFHVAGPGPGPSGHLHRLGTGAHEPGHRHDPGFPGAGRALATQPIGSCRCSGITDGVVRPCRRPCPADPGRTGKARADAVAPDRAPQPLSASGKEGAR